MSANVLRVNNSDEGPPSWVCFLGDRMLSGGSGFLRIGEDWVCFWKLRNEDILRLAGNVCLERCDADASPKGG